MLGRLISYPRNRYQQDGWDLDLAIITDNIIVMSLPTITFPETMYRNNLSHVKKFLSQHSGNNYKVFDFRAEGAGYPDSAFDFRVSHFPFVDHHPPPFNLLILIVDAIHAHLSSSSSHNTSKGDERGEESSSSSVVAPRNDSEKESATAVVHCKAGKGRSGLSICSYLVTYEDWSEQYARALFTRKRMRPGFGEGVSMPSQRRYLRYMQTWAHTDRRYTAQNVKIDKIKVVGLKAGCRLALRRFKDDGASFDTVHEFSDLLEITVNGDVSVMTPKQPVIIEADVGVVLTKASAFAHFWFNTFFEGGSDGGNFFSIEWQEVDGWKGTKWHGTRAYDSISVFWSLVQDIH